jgi:hypothetical protein
MSYNVIPIKNVDDISSRECETCLILLSDEVLTNTDMCTKSKRFCGHHCNCSWEQDSCCWCGYEWGEDE